MSHVEAQLRIQLEQETARRKRLQRQLDEAIADNRRLRSEREHALGIGVLLPQPFSEAVVALDHIAINGLGSDQLGISGTPDSTEPTGFRPAFRRLRYEQEILIARSRVITTKILEWQGDKQARRSAEAIAETNQQEPSSHAA